MQYSIICDDLLDILGRGIDFLHGIYQLIHLLLAKLAASIPTCFALS